MTRQSVLTAALLVFVLPSFVLQANAQPGTADRIAKVEFTSTPAPATPEEMSAAYTRSDAVVTYADGRRKVFPLSYNVLYRPGDVVGGRQAALIVDREGQPIMRSSPDEKGDAARGPFFAFAPDANSLIRLGEKGRERLFLVTQFEYHTEAPSAVDGNPPIQMYAQLPMAMNLAALRQNGKTGRLQATKLSNIDMGPINGLWIPCAASLTPWNTHLAGEEYEPYARLFENAPLEPMNLFLKTPGKTGREGGAKAYDYGHPVEVSVDAGGRTKVVRRYAMGRLAAELAHVMPDERTVYMGDDGRDVVFFMFIADKLRDLSAGTLYAARWEQTEAANGGKAGLRWIRLGHATEAEIKALVDNGISFSDIFESADAEAYKADPGAYPGFHPVYVYGGSAASSKPGSGVKPGTTYLRVRPGMEKAAAFLESRRYAALRGATTEFTKMEGVAHNGKDKRLYVAMSYVEAGMIDGKNADRPRDDIRLTGDPKDLACGAVYESRLGGGMSDTDGSPIPSEWAAVTMEALVTGGRKPFGQTAYGRYDACDTDRMANPDNLKYSEEMRTLFIGEDSGNHLNNFLWTYNVDTAQLTRIMSAPAGAEHTGLQIVPNLNGHTYIMSNIQHPGAAQDLKKYPDEVKVQLRSRVDPRGAVGYISGLPALKR
jgi:secreted PhoX family phosphatase